MEVIPEGAQADFWRTPEQRARKNERVRANEQQHRELLIKTKEEDRQREEAKKLRYVRRVDPPSPFLLKQPPTEEELRERYHKKVIADLERRLSRPGYRKPRAAV